MRVKIKHTKKDGFKPYTVTFFVNTKEESKIFHNKVAMKIAESGKFIGNIYEEKEYDGNFDVSN